MLLFLGLIFLGLTGLITEVSWLPLGRNGLHSRLLLVDRNGLPSSLFCRWRLGIPTTTLR